MYAHTNHPSFLLPLAASLVMDSFILLWSIFLSYSSDDYGILSSEAGDQPAFLALKKFRSPGLAAEAGLWQANSVFISFRLLTSCSLRQVCLLS
jgi:hypothetical protein